MKGLSKQTVHSTV